MTHGSINPRAMLASALAFCAALSLWAAPTRAQNPEVCNAVLKGALDLRETQTASAMRKAVVQLLETNEFSNSASAQKSATDVGIFLPEVGAFDLSDERQKNSNQSWSKAYKSYLDKNYASDSKFYEKIQQQNSASVQAWENCMKNFQTVPGLYCWTTLHEQKDRVYFHAQYKSPGSVGPALRLKKLSHSTNVSPHENYVQWGMSLSGVTTTLILTRRSNLEGVVQVFTDSTVYQQCYAPIAAIKDEPKTEAGGKEECVLNYPSPTAVELFNSTSMASDRICSDLKPGKYKVKFSGTLKALSGASNVPLVRAYVAIDVHPHNRSANTNFSELKGRFESSTPAPSFDFAVTSEQLSPQHQFVTPAGPTNSILVRLYNDGPTHCLAGAGQGNCFVENAVVKIERVN